jgi:hypothetical protein
VIRRPPDLPDSEWEETFTVIQVCDAYKTKNGRVITFYNESHQSRTVAILNIELSAATIRRLQRMGISHR